MGHEGMRIYYPFTEGERRTRSHLTNLNIYRASNPVCQPLLLAHLANADSLANLKACPHYFRNPQAPFGPRVR